MGRRHREPEPSLHGDIGMSHWEPYKYPQVCHDGQRCQEYRSEHALQKTMPDEPLMSNRQMTEFLASVSGDRWFTDRFGSVKYAVTFSKRRKHGAACNYRASRGFTLKFPGDGGMNNRLTALHELTHIICHRQSHGPVYCAVLLQVMIHYMGVVVGHELRRQFAINRVR